MCISHVLFMGIIGDQCKSALLGTLESAVESHSLINWMVSFPEKWSCSAFWGENDSFMELPRTIMLLKEITERFHLTLDARSSAEHFVQVWFTWFETFSDLDLVQNLVEVIGDL